MIDYIESMDVESGCAVQIKVKSIHGCVGFERNRTIVTTDERMYLLDEDVTSVSSRINMIRKHLNPHIQRFS